MINHVQGICAICKAKVEVGDGELDWFRRKWRFRHNTCVTPALIDDKERFYFAKLALLGRGTGITAQRARRKLRDRGL